MFARRAIDYRRGCTKAVRALRAEIWLGSARIFVRHAWLAAFVSNRTDCIPRWKRQTNDRARGASVNWRKRRVGEIGKGADSLAKINIGEWNPKRKKEDRSRKTRDGAENASCRFAKFSVIRILHKRNFRGSVSASRANRSRPIASPNECSS